MYIPGHILGRNKNKVNLSFFAFVSFFVFFPPIILILILIRRREKDEEGYEDEEG